MPPRPAPPRSHPPFARLAGSLVAAVLAAGVSGCGVDNPVGTSGPSAGSSSGVVASPSPSQVATPAPTRPPGKAVDLSKLAISLEPFVSVPGSPLAIAAAPDGSGRLFVASQDGRAWVVKDGKVLPDPLLDLRSRITSGGEQGLLGLAVRPSFPDDPRVFVDYTDTHGDSVVASLEISPDDPDRVDPSTFRQILFQDQPFPNHNGGALVFGPDGDLYISFGDGGSGGDPLGNGQRLDTFLGKILRIDVDTQAEGDAYSIPADNPYADGGGEPEIWEYGLRNPWRISFDRGTGDLWIGDVGQNLWEEVDVDRDDHGGLNFGWNIMEGTHCYGATSCDQQGLTPPVSDYGRDVGCTVIGGYVYRGAAYPKLQGAYVFGDYCSRRLFAIDSTVTSRVDPRVVGQIGSSLSAFGEDAAGELYATTLDGKVWRVVPTFG